MCYQQHTANIPITKNITFQCAPIFNFKCLIYIKDFCVALNDCPSVAKVLFKYRCWTELALYFEQYIHICSAAQIQIKQPSNVYM